MGLPFLCTHQEVVDAARKFYPQLKIHLLEDWTKLERAEIYQSHDCLFYTLFYNLCAQETRGNLHSVLVPHGMSDKGFKGTLLEWFIGEDISLIYGQKWLDHLDELGILPHLRSVVITGNWRLAYYRERQKFYDNLLYEEHLSKLPAGNRTLLYAPTWVDFEEGYSFDDACQSFLQDIPENTNVIVKLHPFLQRHRSVRRRVEALLKSLEGHPRILVLENYPPVLPLLNACDVYLGDTSSVGYDALAFKKPMFFLGDSHEDEEGRYLDRCGVNIPRDRYRQLFDIMEEALPSDEERFSKIRQETYDYAFGKERPFSEVKADICKEYERLTGTPLGI